MSISSGEEGEDAVHSLMKCSATDLDERNVLGRRCTLSPGHTPGFAHLWGEWISLCVRCGALDLEADGHSHVCSAAGTGDAPRDPGIKLDQDKPRVDLVQLGFVLDVARVLAFGAKKYRPNNWKKVKHGRARYRAAVVRHLAAMEAGERLDPETGLPHVAHVGCCAMFVWGFDALGIPDDPVPCGDGACEHCYPGGKREGE